MVLSAGYGTGKTIYPHIAAGTRPALNGAAEAIHRAYLAPFAGLPDAAYHGLRRFPLSIPLDDAFKGNGPAQALHYERLLAWDKPVQFIWGCQIRYFWSPGGEAGRALKRALRCPRGCGALSAEYPRKGPRRADIKARLGTPSAG